MQEVSVMYVARNNPNHFSLICTTSEDVDKEWKSLRDDYKFYSRVLRIIYPKKKLRVQALDKLRSIENTGIHIVPGAKI
jgi:hypothetical protein